MLLYKAFIYGLFSFVLSSIFCGIFFNNAKRFSFHKRSDSERVKLHASGVPRLGGIAIYLSFFIAFAYFFTFNREFFHLYARKSAGLLIAATIILFCGSVDDLVKRLGYKIKFLCQVLAVLVLIFSGYHVHNIALPIGQMLSAEYIIGPLIILWFITIINAINLIDGLDGLASGIATIVLLSFLTINIKTGQSVPVIISAVLIGANLGFLRYNFYPAKLFLGDAGSLLLGLMLGVLSMDSAAKRYTIISLTVPLITLLIPFASVVFTFTRRLSQAQNPFTPDKWHLHYRFLHAGLSHRNTVLVFYAVTAIFAFLGASCFFLPRYLELVILALSGVLMWLLYMSALAFISHKKRLKRKSGRTL